MPVKAGNHLGAGVLIGAYHLAQLFGIKTCCEGSRIYQVAKQHRELATLSG